MLPKRCSIMLGSALFMALLMLSSCASFDSLFVDNHHKSTLVKQKNTVTADAFITNLSLCRLMLSNNPDDMDSIATNLSVVKSYAAASPKSKSGKASTLIVLIIDYKAADYSFTRKIIAPAVSRKGDFPTLQGVFDKLIYTHGTLQNLHLSQVTVTPDNEFTLPTEEVKLLAALDQQQARILQTASNLAPADDIKMQLILIGFYTRRHYQDAAYLTLDNTKRALAQATQKKTIDEPTLAALSKQLELQESLLKTDLPYKF